MTFILVGILCALKMPVFDSFCHAFSTASTGGFGIKAASVAAYNSVGIEVTLTIFMLLFSVNFTVYYLILIGQFIKAIRNEELIWFLAIFAAAVGLIVANLMASKTYANFGTALKDAAFNVSSLMSTSGFGTADYTKWPVFSRIVLFAVMCIGGCAGSTAGGLKVSRIVMLSKSSIINVKKTLSPRSVYTAKMDGNPIDEATRRNVKSFFIIYMFIMFVSVLLISVGNNDFGTYSAFETNFSAVVACFNNVGPGSGAVGPTGNYASYTIFAKLVLCFDMLLGRLEILPILLLFNFKSWKKA